MNTKQPVIYEIPAEGSLGLLALGATGLKLWREKRAQVQKEQENKEKNQQNDPQKP